MPPLATLLLCAYKQEDYVADAVRGALAQTYQPLEIVITDDGSPDRTADIIAHELKDYAGPHKVRFLRQDRNIGLSATVNNALPLITGDYVIGAAGDDNSSPGRVARLVEAYQASAGKASLIYSNAHVTDETGAPRRILYPEPPDPRRHDLDWAAREEFAIAGCTMSWRRDVFDVFGPLPDQLWKEDWVIPFRAALLGDLRYIDDMLVHYREHSGNIYLGTIDGGSTISGLHGELSKRARMEGDAFRAILKDLDTADRHFPDRAEEFDRLREITKRRIAMTGLTERAYGNATFAQKLTATARMLVRQGPGRASLRWLLTLFLPRVYLRRLRLANDRIRRAGLEAYREATTP